MLTDPLVTFIIHYKNLVFGPGMYYSGMRPGFWFFFFFSPEFKSMNLVLYNCAHYIKWSVPLWRIWDETPCSNWFPFLPFQTFWKILVASLIMSSLRDIACHCRRSSLNGVGYLDPFYLIWCQILISAKFGRLIIPELIF